MGEGRISLYENPYQFYCQTTEEIFFQSGFCSQKQPNVPMEQHVGISSIRTHLPQSSLGLCNSLTGNDDSRTDIIASPAEAAGLRSDLKGHTHFSPHSSSDKSESFSVHLF
jgi:hypothetical protein